MIEGKEKAGLDEFKGLKERAVRSDTGSGTDAGSGSNTRTTVTAGRNGGDGC